MLWVAVIMFVGFVWGLAFLIQRGAKASLKKLNSYEKCLKEKDIERKNPYILRHKVLKLDNDKNYDEYLDWCYRHDEIPTSKEIFLKEVEAKEKELKSLINGI